MMTSITAWLPILTFMCGMVSFISKHKHLLNTLISLEFMMLSVFWELTTLLTNLPMQLYLVLFFLALLGCESAIGLSLLITMVRTHGNDRFNTLTTLKC